MNDIDLREQFHDWAAPLRAAVAPEFSAIRRRARRRTARLAALAGGAVAVIAIGATLAASSLTAGSAPAPPQSRLWGSGPFPAPRSAPYVFVNTSASGPAELRDGATGTVVKVLRPLGGAVNFTAAAAAANDRTFVLAQQGSDGQVSFAELRIGNAPGGAHAPVRLVPVRITAALPAGCQVYFMTVNASATRLALDVVTGGGTASSLIVYDLSNGRLIGSWPTRTDGVVSPPQFLPGDRIVAQWPAAGSHSPAPGHGPVLRPRVISAARPFPAGSSFLADSRPVRGLAAIGGVISQDGSISMNTLEGSLAGSRTGDDETVRLREYSTASGRLLYNIPVGSASALQTQYYCGVLWASANGRDLLTQCGTRQQEVVDGKVTRVKLAWTFLAPRTPTTTVAW